MLSVGVKQATNIKSGKVPISYSELGNEQESAEFRWEQGVSYCRARHAGHQDRACALMWGQFRVHQSSKRRKRMYLTNLLVLKHISASQWDRALEKLVHMDAEPAAQAPNVSKTKPRLCIVIPVFQCILPLDHCWNPNFWPWLLHSMAIELNLCLLAVCWTNLWRSEWIPYSLDQQTPLAFSRELLWHS